MADDEKKKKEDETSALRNISISSANTETVGRYGSANAEYVKAYTGVDNETGRQLNRGLKKIAGYSAPDEKAIKQQAGFSAEVHVTADRNAANIIADKKTRTVRTDDLPDKFGNNHPVYDHVDIDENGTVVVGSGSQMKFNSDKGLLDKGGILDKIAKGRDGQSNDLSRYLEAKLDLPSEQVERAREYCAEQMRTLREQADKLEAIGKGELAVRKRAEAANYEKLRGNIRDSGMTSEQAVLYRKHPTLATTMDIATTSHRAGIEGAKFGAAIGGAISMVTNVIAACQDDKELKEALLDTAKDTGKAAVVGYSTAFVGSAVKGVLQQSTSTTARTIARTSLPAMAVTVCLELGSAVARYTKGEIDETEFLETIGEKGSCMLASGLGATLGQIAIPVPVVGALIGGMVGYTLSSMLYRDALAAFKEAKRAREDYLQIKAFCEEARATMEAYRVQFQRQFAEWLEQGRTELAACLHDMDAAVGQGRMADFASAANALAACLGKSLDFADRPEFDNFMATDATLVL